MKRTLAKLVSVAAASALSIAAAPEARADSKQECAAAYEATQTLRGQSKLVEARQQAVRCSASTCSAFVTKDCTQWLAEIDASLPTVVFTAEDAAGADTTAVRVSVDGRPLGERLDGKAVPLDPGEHVIRFEMVGADAVEQKVLIRQGEKNRRLAASFKKAAPAPPPPAPPPPPTAPPPAAPTAVPAAPAEKPSGGVPVWAWITGGTGLVALGIGAGFGVGALRAQSSLTTKCGGDPARCPASTKDETVPLAAERDRDRNVFIGLGSVGFAAIVAGVVGIVTAPKKSAPAAAWVVSPLALPGGAGLAIGGVL